MKGGKTSDGNNVESKSMGSLDPEVAQSLVKAFKEGIKLLPKILEILPELIEKFDKDLTKEATERVEKNIEDEEAKMKDDEQNTEETEDLNQEENSDIVKDGITASDTEQVSNPAVEVETESTKE